MDGLVFRRGRNFDRAMRKGVGDSGFDFSSPGTGVVLDADQGFAVEDGAGVDEA